MKSIYENGFVKSAVNECGGSLHPLVFNWDRSKGCTIMNPSVFKDGDTLRVNFRLTNYTLNFSERLRYPAPAGYYAYIFPEGSDITTENYICDLDENLNVINPRYVEMLTDVHSGKWIYKGLEDARLIKWGNELYLSGTRRDIDESGTGRIELSKIELHDSRAVEVGRFRLPSTDPNSYCEKNWMPVPSLPFYYIKWTNPTELVRIGFDKEIHTDLMIRGKDKNLGFELRGGTHVILYNNYYIAFGHTSIRSNHYTGSGSFDYYTRLMVWDKNFNLVKVSDGFKLLNSRVEFQCGLCYDLDNKHMLLSFSDSDNSSYICRFDPQWLLNLILN